MRETYMLDTNICSFIMREMPPAILERLERCVMAQGKIVVSAITYSEMLYGTIGPKAKPRHIDLVSTFIKRLDAILPWGTDAVDETIRIRAELNAIGMPIGHNDAAIAGHAIATQSILVTNNTSEFERVKGLRLEDWTQPHHRSI